MAYFLKQAKLKGRTYISICESFYNHDKKGTAHRTYKSLGSIETHKANGLEDPVAFFQQEVDKLNREKEEKGSQKIGDKTPLVSLGYFPLKSLMERMQIEKFINLFKLTNDFRYDPYELLSSLVYARAVNPCSKLRTFHDVIPSLYCNRSYSYDQMMDGLAFFGLNYEKFVELFTSQTNIFFGIDTKKTYFDCTNFYFEIDREDDFRRKGPSKENRKEPIVGLGLLLDKNLLPIGMKMYPGNASEKPILPEVISKLKARHNVNGRTIHVADKGLNCITNIIEALKRKDGYLFSKSVKTLSEAEKVWVFFDNDYKDIKDSRGNVIYRCKSCVDDFVYKVTQDGKTTEIHLKEKRLVTYNPKLAKKQTAEINKMVDKALNMTTSDAKRKQFGESAKYLNLTGKEGERAIPSLNVDQINKDLSCAGYNMLVTSELDMSDKDMYETYHNLWRIEESFRIMKSDLDARPVYVQTENSIKGHFLVCYITVLLERLFQFKILENRFSSSEIFELFRNLNVVKVDGRFINTASASNLIDFMSANFGIPLNHLGLSETQIKGIMGTKLKPVRR